MARAGLVVILFCYFLMSMAKYIRHDIPEECKRYGICANVENYPTELARKLIAELKAQNTIFNVDELIEEPAYRFRVETRICGGTMPEISHKRSLCQTTKTSLPVKLAYHESGDLKYILNDHKPIQVFNVGKCSNSNGTRDDISMLCRSETIQMGYEGQCMEKKRLVEMYYIEGNRSAKGYFHVPTCCSCILRHT